MISYEEKFRRLEALDSATCELEKCEQAFAIVGEDALEPFYRWPSDGDVCVIYDRNGRVDHVVENDEGGNGSQYRSQFR